MFYLKFISDFLVSHRLSVTILWVIALISILMTLSFSRPIDDFAAGLKGKKTNPYFFAMMPTSENISYVQRKVGMLPGVERVKLLSPEKVSNEIQKTLKAYDSEVDATELTLDYGGLEVVLAIGLQARSQELIRQYIKRVVESPDLLIGPIERSHSMGQSSHILAKFLSRYASMSLLSFFMVLYLIASLMMIKVLKKQAFLIETFQRRRGVFRLSFLTLHAPVTLILLMFSFQSTKVALVFFLIILAFITSITTLNRRVIEC
jgi:hypothetical protein